MEDRGTSGVITGAKLGASPEESLPCNKYCSPTFPFRLSIGPLRAGAGPVGAGVGPRGDVRGTGGGLHGSARAHASLF